MPLYEFACVDCKSQAELLIRGGESPTCPTCGSSRLEKQLSVVAAHSSSTRGELPICDAPQPSGGCGLPQCGTGGCQFG